MTKLIHKRNSICLTYKTNYIITIVFYKLKKIIYIFTSQEIVCVKTS